jgi:hypothetical protein
MCDEPETGKQPSPARTPNKSYAKCLRPQAGYALTV